MLGNFILCKVFVERNELKLLDILKYLSFPFNEMTFFNRHTFTKSKNTKVD